MGSILAILIFAFTLFGMPAVKIILAFSLIAALFFMLLRALQLDTVESIILSAVFAMGIFATYAYWLALLFNSVWTAMIISLVLIASLAAYFHFYAKHMQRKQLYILASIIALIIILYLLAYLFVIRSMPVPGYVQQFYDCIKNLDALACSQKY